MAQDGLRPILKEIEQDTLDIAKVFKLLSLVEVGKLKAIDVYFTEQGKGYLNALASLNPRLFVINEEKYIKLKLDNSDLIKLNKILISDNLELKEVNSKIANKQIADLLLIDVYKKEITKLKATIDKLRKPKRWEFWK